MEEKTDLDVVDAQRAGIGLPVTLGHLSLVLARARLDALDDPAELLLRFASDAVATDRALRSCRLAGDEPSEEHGKEHEVIVLDPNHVALLDLRENDLSERKVDRSVGEPVRLVEVHLSCKVST